MPSTKSPEDLQTFEISYTIQKGEWISSIHTAVVNATSKDEAIKIISEEEAEFELNIISINSMD